MSNWTPSAADAAYLAGSLPKIEESEQYQQVFVRWTEATGNGEAWWALRLYLDTDALMQSETFGAAATVIQGVASAWPGYEGVDKAVELIAEGAPGEKYELGGPLYDFLQGVIAASQERWFAADNEFWAAVQANRLGPLPPTPPGEAGPLPPTPDDAPGLAGGDNPYATPLSDVPLSNRAGSVPAGDNPYGTPISDSPFPAGSVPAGGDNPYATPLSDAPLAAAPAETGPLPATPAATGPLPATPDSTDDLHSRNQANLDAMVDGATISYWMIGPRVLAGDNHHPDFVAQIDGRAGSIRREGGPHKVLYVSGPAAIEASGFLDQYGYSTQVWA